MKPASIATPVMVSILVSVLVLVSGVFFGSPAWGHGGEDHGEEAHEAARPPQPAGTAMTGDTAPAGERQGEAASELYELVLRAARLEAGSPQEITILLADFETNRPVQGATVELELSGPATASVQAAAAKDPGIYVASLRLPEPGTYQLIASIIEGGNADLLTVDGLVVQKAEAGPGVPALPLAGLVLGAAAGVLALGIYLAARRRSRPATLLVALIVPLAGQPSWAHAGHDDAEPAGGAPAPPGATIRIPKESQFLLGIRTEPAKEREIRQTASLLGRLEAPPHQVAQLHAPVPGRLASQAMALLGDRVRKGQVLAVVEQVLSTSEQIQLASERLKLDIERARLDADIAQAEQDAARAQADLGRAQRLRDIVPRKALLEAEIGLRKAQEGLRGLRTQRSLFWQMKPPEIGQARRFSVVAPFAGEITESHATFGEQVEPSKLLFRVVDTRILWAVADVFERDLTRVAQARGAKVRLDAMPGKAYPARLASFGTVVDARTRSLPARFEIPNYIGRLKPGMFARVEVDLGGSRKALSVPRDAVSRLGDDPVVFVHSTAEQFAIRPVTLGAEDGSWVVVAAGLTPGERVVTEGVFQLKTTAEKGAARK